jgi:NADP-dependent aldehyde dehydrogenase
VLYPSKTNFPGFSPANNSFLQDHINLATETQLEYVLQFAGKAFVPYRNLSTNERAEFLDAIA